ncbi:hypothetical protein LUZ60_000989 [Juncus effusus]|nr:hypothetical protein LUZ60_000989 [Juncus effusus]
MADYIKSGPFERDVDQAITSLKKGAYLLKYGRRGKPKFCPFRLSNDETMVVWYSGKDEKHLKLSQVSKIIPGQRTAIFARYPRPEKEYQSFSLLYGDRSLDLICKDKDEAEAWFVGLKAIIARNQIKKLKMLDSKSARYSADSQSTQATKESVSVRNPPVSLPTESSLHKGTKDTLENLIGPISNQIHPTNGLTSPNQPPNPIGFNNLFSDVILYTGQQRRSTNSDHPQSELYQNGRVSSYDSMRASMSSVVSSSSHGSGHEDFDALGDVLIWGDKLRPHCNYTDLSLPRQLESTSVYDVHAISCGARHAVLVTKQGEVYSWGEEFGGRLGHGTDSNVSHPKLVSVLSGLNVERVACGEFHSCAVTLSGDLYTWGDGVYKLGILGHGNDTGHWIPKRVCGPFDGLCVSSVSCGPWHTVVLTSAGTLFTFGEGEFGALGHGDRERIRVPREVEAFKDMRVVKAACGVWHTAAIAEITDSPSDVNSPSGRIFTWGDGDKYRLGHGDLEPKLVPTRVAYLSDMMFCRVACGHDMTVCLSVSGKVYTMGSSSHGQLGHPGYDGKLPRCVEGRIRNSFVEEISCGAHHVAVLTAKTEVYTWGKGANGRLGHRDENDLNAPTLVEALKDKQVKTIVCGSDFTAAICVHKWVSSADQSSCSGCRLPFGFRRKRHNCYNCGLVFCKACSSRKALRASLAPNMHKPYRVCDECYSKLKKPIGEYNNISRPRTPTAPPTPTPKDRLSNDETQTLILDTNNTKPLSRVSSAESRNEIRRNPNRLPPSMYHCNNNYTNYNNNHTINQTNSDSSKKIFSASVPASRAQSRSTSPLTWRLSPPHSTITRSATTCLTSPELFVNSPKREHSLTEVSKLRSQVEELTRKSEYLEVELERTSNKLREATHLAEEESEKNKAANEVIMSLSTQLREMAEHLHDGCNTPNSLGGTSSMDRQSVHLSFDSHIHNNHHNNNLEELNERTGGVQSNFKKASLKEGEWIEQVEPGVYITVTSNSHSADKFLKRVRFSRKKFTEQQAESWWTHNRFKLKDKYGILSGNSKRNPSKIPNPRC